MDKPENYYAILGVPVDADSETLKQAYRQLARRFHPDLVGEGSAIEMKRINRAYTVLSDPEKRQQYDMVIGGVIDLRGHARLRPRPSVVEEDLEFAGLNIFSTRGPWHKGQTIASSLGVISALSSVETVRGIRIAAGSLDGKGMLWEAANGTVSPPIGFVSDPGATIESVRDIRFSEAGFLVAGWGRLHLHVWDGYDGSLLWSLPVSERAVSAHYSLDMALLVTPDGKRSVRMALPHMADGGPRFWGFRATDVSGYDLGSGASALSDLALCAEEGMENRQFWSIRLRALSNDAQTLTTLSCAHIPHETQEMAVVRNWDLSQQVGRKKQSQIRPQIVSAAVVGRCADCTPPYVATPDGRVLAFVYAGTKLRIYDSGSGKYSELLSGRMGSSSKLAISSDSRWVAVAREDSEINEGVIDMWSVETGQIVQKFYHPWQISALHFAGRQLVVALTDGSIHIWE